MRLHGARRVVTLAATASVAGAAVALTIAVSVVPGRAPAELTAPVAATGLPAFDGCAQLRAWQVRTALTRVGPWGLGGPVMTPMTTMTTMGTTSGTRAGASTLTPGTAAAAGTDQPVGSSPSGTNVQEAGVDEPDVAKTDGRVVVRLTGADLVVTDVTGTTAREVSRLRLPGRTPVAPELLLHDGHVVVVGQQPVPVPLGGGPVLGGESGVVPRAVPVRPGTAVMPVAPRPRVRVLAIDLTSTATPRVVGDRTVDGSLVAARQYADGTVRLVVSTPTPLPFVVPGHGLTGQQALRRNRAVVRQAPAQAWLPTVRSADGTTRPLLRCDQVRHPLRPSGPGTLSIVGFAADAPGRLHATAVTAAGDLAYSSADHVYVGTTSTGATTVHAFALDGPRATYAASGTVAGTVGGRWSFDEHGGRLRVVTSLGDPWRPRASRVVVLEQRGGRLLQVGRSSGVGRGEQVTAVRWFGDLAVVVTFRKTDPLHTVDLSDPTRPRVAGELRVPGYSSYLHPVGGGLLVGVGHDATAAGADRGAQVATFDVTDPAAVRRTAALRLGAATDVPVAADPRLFSYLPSARVLLTPVEHWDTGTTDVVALHVGVDGALRRVATWGAGPAGTSVRTLPLGGDRLALVGDGVRLVDVP